MATWQTIEHWQTTSPDGRPKSLWLKQLDDLFSRGWRVEWEGLIHHEGESFTTSPVDTDLRPEECEPAARTLLSRRMAELGGTWERIS